MQTIKELEFNLFNLLDDLVSITNKDGIIIKCNNSFSKYLDIPISSIIGKHENELFNSYRLDAEKHEEKLAINNNLYYFKTKKEPIKNEEEIVTITIRKDITESRNLSTLYEEDKKILKQIASSCEIEAILDDIINSAEKMNLDMKCSILLLGSCNNRLYSASAPSIPEFYTKKISGMEIGEKVGSCGAAAFLEKRVVVENIQTHENWQLAKNLANKAGLYACWSQPIFSSRGNVLGTFAMYYSEPKKPTAFDLYLIEDRASLAGIAIEKYYNELQIKKNLENEKKQEELLMHQSKQAMMGEMLENIAHQWRQPLSVISTSATGLTLKKELGINDDENEISALKGINENAQYLSKTIDDFRNYFKSSNTTKLFNLKDTLEKTLQLIEVSLKSNHITLINEFEEIHLSTLENQLIQVLMNIFNNAVDELSKSSLEDRYVLINSYKNKDNAVIKIVDSAGGASQSIVNKVFEPYFTTKQKSNGTGIGLYMCKEIVEKHMEGLIEANNTTFEINDCKYKGLEFTIKIPIRTIEPEYQI